MDGCGPVLGDAGTPHAGTPRGAIETRAIETGGGMSERAIRAVWLYPELMNVYADRGNVIALRALLRRARSGLRGAKRLSSAANCRTTWTSCSSAAGRTASNGVSRRTCSATRPGCTTGKTRASRSSRCAAGFQLFGDGYRTSRGEELPGVGLFDVTTVAPPPGAERCVGDVLAETGLGAIGEVVGFENHAGRTYLGPGVRPFARVRHGWGNNGADGTEGAVTGSALGTYLHGSLLPRNPRITDWLVAAALRHRYGPGAAIEERPEGAYAVEAKRAGCCRGARPGTGERRMTAGHARPNL